MDAKKVLVQVGKNKYIAEVIVGFTSDKNMLLYDIIGLTHTAFTVTDKKIGDTQDREVIEAVSTINNSIRNYKTKVNSNAKNFTLFNVKSPKPSQNNINGKEMQYSMRKIFVE